MPPPGIVDVVPGLDSIIATAIHNGHYVRPEVAGLLRLSPEERLREEDPYTGQWTEITSIRAIGRRSRFEVDLNRPREKAVYLRPEDAWGLRVWKQPPTQSVIDHSLKEYDLFYESLEKLLHDATAANSCVAVLDLHSYNYRRAGSTCEPDDPLCNPQINIGTGSLDRERWAPVVDRLIRDLSAFEFCGEPLDVRENVKFRGGYMANWINHTFPTSVCAIAIDIKKFFMDEWTGETNPLALDAIRCALASTLPGLREELNRCRP